MKEGEEMDAMEAILSRRSIRRYTSQKLSDQLIKELLEAAMSAPSAGNEQPWHFIIIDDRKVLEQIPSFHPYSGMLREAPLAILICADLDLGNEGFLIQDGSAATENLLIAAHAKGLGAVWLGIYPLKERITGMRKLLAIPERILPLSLIAVGYPAERIPREKRYQPSRIHTNQW
jgi:nitroreductase